jgi:hydroxyacylglutathione hydrolase
MTIQATLVQSEFSVTTIVTGGSWKENCYLVHHLSSGEGVLIDPGDSADLIIRSVETSGANLRHILLTHAHHDHVGAVTAVCRHFGLPCQLHKGDARLIRHAPLYSLRFAGKKIEVPETVETYEGQPTFYVGTKPIVIMHTPGHTAGSVCLRFERFVFTGDTLLYQHVGRTDLPGGNVEQLSASVSQFIETLPGETILFPGHRRTWTIQEARVWWRSVGAVLPQYYGTDS